ncbi:MAG: NAD(P)-dependent oxidoreductase [Caldilineaceae bacterium]
MIGAGRHGAQTNTFANWTERRGGAPASRRDGGHRRLRGDWCSWPTAAAHAAGAGAHHKRTRLPANVEAELGITYATPAALFAASDILCCLLPYSAATDMSLNAAVFAALPPGALVVLRQRRHRRGCLGPRPAWRTSGRRRIGHLQWEPLLPDNPLLALARDPAMNVLLTPHTAAGTGAGRGGRAGDYVHVVRALADGHAS